MELVAHGTFGSVYKEQNQVIKIANDDIESKENINNEIRFLKRLKGFSGFPYMKDYLYSSYIRMDILGPGLDELLDTTGGTFSMKTCLMIGYYMMSCLETLKKCNIVHNDIKPENICVCNHRQICLIDFGLAEFLLDRNRRKNSFVGTCRYASINALQGIPTEIHDDIESVFYTIVYLHYGTLPWIGYPEHEKRSRVLQDKYYYEYSLFNDFPKPIQISFNSTAIRPPSSMMHNFKRALQLEGYVFDDKFDWMNL